MLNCYLELFVSWCAEAEVVPEAKKKRKKVVKRAKVRALPNLQLQHVAAVQVILKHKKIHPGLCL